MKRRRWVSNATAKYVLTPIRRRRALVRQYDRADCGPAALATLVRYLGGDVPLATVRELCRTTRSGTSLAQLEQAARALGLDADACSGAYESLSALAFPAIAHLTQPDARDHFVVVYHAGNDGVVIGDPANGLLRLSRADFEARWQSRAALCTWAVRNRSTTPHGATSDLIRSALRGQRVWIGQCAFLGLVLTALGLLTSAAVQFVIDDVLPNQRHGALTATAILLACVVALRVCIGYARQRALVTLSSRVGKNINTAVVRALFRLPLAFFETRRTGDLTVRLTDMTVLQNGVMRVIGAFAIDGCFVAGGIAILLAYTTRIGWLVLAGLAVYSAAVWRGMSSVRREQARSMGELADLEAAYIEAVASMETIVTSDSRAAFAVRLVARTTNYQRTLAALGVEQARLLSTTDALSSTLSLAVLIIGASLVMSHSLRLGEMVLV